MATYLYRVAPAGIFRNNRLYAAGEMIPSEKVIVSKGLIPADEVTQIAVKAKRIQVEAERAKTPADLHTILAKSRAQSDALALEVETLRAQLLQFQKAALTAEVAAQEPNEKVHSDNRAKRDFLGNSTTKIPAVIENAPSGVKVRRAADNP